MSGWKVSWVERTLEELRAEATATWALAMAVGNTAEHPNGDLVAVVLPPGEQERWNAASVVTSDLRARGAVEIGWIFPSTIRSCVADGLHDHSRCGLRPSRHVLIGFALREGEGTRARIAYRRARGKRPAYGPWEPFTGMGDHPESNPLLAAIEDGFRNPRAQPYAILDA